MRFNRTFMELKHNSFAFSWVNHVCFNRTFMELKPRKTLNSTLSASF